MAEQGDGKEGGRRRASADARRKKILEAALSVFLAEGYVATRMDHVAARAGVAKGTIYVHFADKEALFRSLIHEEIGPVIASGATLAASFEGSTRDLLGALASVLQRELLGTQRADILRLVISEAPRFPWLAKFYWHEVVERGMALIRAVAARGVARGELASDTLQRFPQIVAAPLLVSVIWQSLFEPFEPLDTEAFLNSYIDMLMRGLACETA
ncbi:MULTISPECIES: TetR/AcrR family transcriptional regulator [unclassified Chelatococcus]|jgi:AcrR family transcriptional regulator|uniref:TetR/AcrR family transcriptional regulator n=1 Tax=unclassified Chelatococcus TaxID=2638111 RepID=UPI001BCCFC67|nr:MULTISPECIES: TetR/AcrR family transcriptional regulator [unclassified Chelatococcus]CAH1667792.1 TetR family transcriptional regulator [Hyphomicrobiales bacterium]MBS7738072.1 TetR/AcrR family transcriptional regulator [Chelatococcus sp. HY11]MBX3546289.1 TetR/AcrR family transcriptional regulator [Chelatococcus sp.]MCO5077583.1 TetR/AcrR family transcriptional regulator [Chelatococcus sp.]CAH1679395.1 TetR family transcriptional regulator [Hyphomicrobiales bacterium]